MQFSAEGYVTLRKETFFTIEAPDKETAVIKFAQGLFDTYTNGDEGDLEEHYIKLNTIQEGA